MPRVALVALACSIAACSGETAPAPARVTEPPAAATEPPKVAAPRAVVEDAGPIGVEACDGYVEEYRRCAESLPADERSLHAQVIEGQRAAWARAKADPALAEGLADACAAAKAAARVSLPQCKGW